MSLPDLHHIKAVLFDLDGTLIQTAIDLIDTLQSMQKKYGVGATPFDELRAAVPMGSVAMINAAFPNASDDEKLTLKDEFLNTYANNLHKNPILYDGIEAVIDSCESKGIKWGIVTNKPRFLTEPLLRHANIEKRLSVLVCGDDLEHRKPHPMPLEYASSELGLAPEQCVYIGDDERDVTASHAANMMCLVASYDAVYTPDHPPHSWGGSGVLDTPESLHALAKKLKRNEKNEKNEKTQ